MRALDLLLRPREEQRHTLNLPAGLYAPDLHGWPTAMPNYSYSTKRVEVPDGSFTAYVDGIHRNHGVIAAAVEARALLLSQLRFRWRSLVDSDNGRMFGNAALELFESPNEWQTLPELLKAAEYHASYSGNAYIWRDGQSLRLLNPEWVSVILGSNLDADDARFQADLRIVEYVYQPGGQPSYGEPLLIDPGEMAHWRPEPDPTRWWRGQSWVQSVLSEFVIDRAATQHTAAFFENAATPNLVFSLDASVTQEQVKTYAEMLAAGHSGAANAYRNLVIGGGADVQVVGSEMNQLSMRDISGSTETRIAVRARIPAPLLGIREGMQGSSLTAGNYSQTRRNWADSWFSPTARNLCAVLQNLVTAPRASELTFDPAAILFLQDDRLDEANILQANANTLRALVDAGYDPSSAVLAVQTSDITKLRHSGLYSVQLQPPGTGEPEPASDDSDDDDPARSVVLNVSNPVNIAGGSTSFAVGEAQVSGERFDVTTDAVNVERSEVGVDARAASVALGSATITGSDFTVNDSQGLVVERSDVTVQGSDVVVNEAPGMNVERADVTVDVDQWRPVAREVSRDGEGRITGITETDSEGNTVYRTVRRDDDGNIAEIIEDR